MWRRDDAALAFIGSRRGLLLLLVAALVAVACWLLLASSSPLAEKYSGTREERLFDQWQRQGRWDKIVDYSREHAVQSLACRKVALLAQWRQGNTSVDLKECFDDSREVLTSQTAALMMSDSYMQLGMPAMAQRAAFDAMVKTNGKKLRERPLRRLVEAALVMNQPQLAMKYITILEDYSSSSEWAQSMKLLAQHPELIYHYPTLSKLRKSYENAQDAFFL